MNIEIITIQSTQSTESTQYIIQSYKKLTSPIIQFISALLYPNTEANYNQNLDSFYAPYTNYYTTFSTTLIQILEKTHCLESNDNLQPIIRIEPIYTTPQDPLIYKQYKNITDYINQLSQNQQKDETPYFEPISNHPLLLSSIQNYFNLPESTITNHQLTYFDIMNWIQCNSEHSRHWVFRTPIPTTTTTNNNNNPKNTTTLFNMIKSTLLPNDNNSLIAFADNSSAILGDTTEFLRLSTKNTNSQYEIINTLWNPILTAETHNYPTYYHPFEGAGTGVGGRIRDALATGCGSMSLASLIGYSVNSLELLKGASDGASDYGNKLGEPCLGGFLRYHSRFEKPIMFSGGLGFIRQSHIPVPNPIAGDYVVKIGPSGMKIGFGGSIQSSVSNNAQDKDMTAIQRGDPYNGNKITRFLEYLATMDKPIIKKIHDQGAGGVGNVITELLDGWDCLVDVENLPSVIGMDTLECWLSEYQEQMVFICSPDSYTEVETIAKREGTTIYKLGTILDTKNSTIYLQRKNNNLTIPPNTYIFRYNNLNKFDCLNQYSKLLQSVVYNNPEVISSIFKDYHKCGSLDVCREHILERSFKSHLTNKVDRCVSGCVVQQSCIGPYSIPLANYSIVRATPVSQGGILSAIGENIYIGQTPNKWIDKTVAELVCNLAGVPELDFNKIKLSGNWMTFSKSAECLQILYKGVSRLTELLIQLGFAIDGGKDSLSMSMSMSMNPSPNSTHSNIIISPPTLVLTSYSYISETAIEKRVLPLLQNISDSTLFVVDILEYLSSSNLNIFWEIWNNLQALINNKCILALHDGSNIQDILEELSVASGITINHTNQSHQPNQSNQSGCIFEHHYLIIQISNTNKHLLHNAFQSLANIDTLPNITILQNIFNDRMKLSLELDKSTIPYTTNLYIKQPYLWPILHSTTPTTTPTALSKKQIKIAIIRDEGSNSHREMASAFMQLPNTQCIDYTINQLIEADKIKLQEEINEFLECNGFVFVGGFSYGDVLGSGRATALIMKTRLGHIFNKIFTDTNKFVLGVCNGCQILVEYGLFGKNVRMQHNHSQKFECRWTSVNYYLPVSKFQAKLGIWNAHGEGRFELTNGWEYTNDPIGTYQTSEYPFNPNGSTGNIIGLKSKDFRHYCIMPHPERSLFKWQCEYIPQSESNKYEGKYTPWIEFFQSLF